MGVEIKIEGLAEMQQKLSALPSRIQKKILRPALENAGSIIQDVAQQRAPYSAGFLSSHIVFKVEFGSDLQASVKVGPDKSAFWGLYSELGTAPHQETSRDGKTFEHPGEPARPWLRPALTESGAEATQALADVISEMWDQVTT
jgi:HK97 gp10 family phage protein